MRKKQVEEALRRYFAPKFPGLEVWGDLLVERNGAVLCGIAINRSQMASDMFDLMAFSQLLTVPRGHIAFGLSRHLGGYSIGLCNYEVFADAVAAAESEGRTFLDRARTREALLKNVDSLIEPLSDRRQAFEVRAHCMILGGDCKGAQREVDKLIEAVDPPDAPYERAWLERACALRAATERSCSEAAGLLDEWFQSTLSQLTHELPDSLLEAGSPLDSPR